MEAFGSIDYRIATRRATAGVSRAQICAKRRFSDRATRIVGYSGRL